MTFETYTRHCLDTNDEGAHPDSGATDTPQIQCIFQKSNSWHALQMLRSPVAGSRWQGRCSS